MRSEVDGFSAQHENRVVDKVLATTNSKNAAEFRRSLTEHLDEIGRSTAQVELAEHMKRIMIPVLDFKPPTTLPEVIAYLRQQSIEHGDPTQPKGERGIPFLLKGNLAGRAVPKLLAKNISFYDALNLICQATGTSFFLQEGTGKVIVVVESTRAEDLAGNERTVQTNRPGLFNLMAREYTYNNAKSASANAVHNSSSAVIHLIDGPLMTNN